MRRHFCSYFFQILKSQKIVCTQRVQYMNRDLRARVLESSVSLIFNHGLVNQ